MDGINIVLRDQASLKVDGLPGADAGPNCYKTTGEEAVHHFPILTNYRKEYITRSHVELFGYYIEHHVP